MRSLPGSGISSGSGVYQELYLGEDVILCCGKDFIPLRALYLLVAVGYRYRRMMSGHWIMVLGAAPMLAAGSTAPGGRPRKQPLLSLLAGVADLECFYPGDKIYGPLSMVEWGQIRPIEPDYARTRDVFEFAVEVVAKVQELTREGVWIPGSG